MCVYIHMRTCIHTYIYTYMHACIHATRPQISIEQTDWEQRRLTLEGIKQFFVAVEREQCLCSELSLEFLEALPTMPVESSCPSLGGSSTRFATCLLPHCPLYLGHEKSTGHSCTYHVLGVAAASPSKCVLSAAKLLACRKLRPRYDTLTITQVCGVGRVEPLGEIREFMVGVPLPVPWGHQQMLPGGDLLQHEAEGLADRRHVFRQPA